MKHKDVLKHVSDNELDFLRFIINKAEIGSWVRDNQHDLARVDSFMIKMWGMEGKWKPGEWVSFSKQMLPMISELSEKNETKLKAVFSGKDQDDKFTIQHKINCPNAVVKTCEVRIEVHSRDENRVPIVMTGVNIDVSDLIVTQEKAYIDPLTKAYNRNKLYEQYEKLIPVTEIEKGRLLIMLDLDSFKKINDSRGHQAGDLALKAFSKTISQSIRNDDELYRLGGDEFIIISSAVSNKEAHLIIERIINKVSKVSRPVKISSSIGAVHFTKSIQLEKALSLADKELYKVKGGNNKGGYSMVAI